MDVHPRFVQDPLLLQDFAVMLQLLPHQVIADQFLPDQDFATQSTADHDFPVQEVPDHALPDHDFPFQVPPVQLDSLQDFPVQSAGFHGVPKMSISPERATVPSESTFVPRAPCSVPSPVARDEVCVDSATVGVGAAYFRSIIPAPWHRALASGTGVAVCMSSFFT